MKTKELELDNFIEETIGATVSFHAITWNRGCIPALIPSGGNINHHSMPVSGTVPHSHEFAEIIMVLNGRIYHRVNGERQLLAQNTLVFVRPADIHSFEPAEESEREPEHWKCFRSVPHNIIIHYAQKPDSRYCF